MDDLLARAVEAARGVGSASPTHAAQTRSRLLTSLVARRSRNKRAPAWLLLAAVMVSGGAWAANAAPVRHLLLSVRGTPSVAVVASTAATTAAPKLVPSPPSAAPDLVPAPVLAPVPALPPVPVLHAPTTPSTPPSPAVDLDGLYLAAHRAHFSGGDPAKALAAWNQYLAAAPADPHRGFVLEAKYNRAICLLRLGRSDEARAALEPFDRGVGGGYRKDDAHALLDALDRRRTTLSQP